MHAGGERLSGNLSSHNLHKEESLRLDPRRSVRMATQQPRKPYKTDLTDAQWALVEPLLPPAKHGGRPRTVDLREVGNTLVYQSRAGVQWELLPHDLLPKSTVYDYFKAWCDDGTWQRLVDALR